MIKKKVEIIDRHISDKIVRQRISDGYINRIDLFNLIAQGAERNSSPYKEPIPNYIKLIRPITDSEISTDWIQPKSVLQIAETLPSELKDALNRWIYEWMLEHDFQPTRKEDMKAKKETKKKPQENSVPKGFEEKIQKTLDYNPKKK